MNALRVKEEAELLRQQEAGALVLCTTLRGLRVSRGASWLQRRSHGGAAGDEQVLPARLDAVQGAQFRQRTRCFA